MADSFRFFHPIRVRFAETDLQRHVFFGNYFTYFDVAAIEYMRAVGYDYQTMIGEGYDLVYASTRCDYVGRAFFDETLNVHARIGRVGNSSLRFDFDIREVKTGRAVARGEIVAVMVGADAMRPVRVPDSFRRAIAAFEKSGKRRDRP